MKIFSYKSLLGFLISVMVLSSIASRSQSDSLPQTKMFDHFVSLQANELLRQIISFDESPEVRNPFLFKYTLRHNNTGFAFNAGFGFSNARTVDENEVEIRTEMNDLRLGLGYQKQLGKIIEAGVGIDYLVGRDRVETLSITVQEFQQSIDSTYATSKQVNTRSGFGIQGSLSFVIAKWFTIGTEFSIQYIKSTEGFNAINQRYLIPTDPFFIESASITTVNEKDDRTTSEVILPIAIFIGIRF